MKTFIILSLLLSGCAVPSFEQRMAFASVMMGASQSFNRTPYQAAINQPVQVQIIPAHTGLTCATVNCK